MFYDILRIFDFLSPKRTEEPYPRRKPMAIPVDEPLKVVRHCQQIFQKLAHTTRLNSRKNQYMVAKTH
jgi:hypothetical protein